MTDCNHPDWLNHAVAQERTGSSSVEAFSFFASDTPTAAGKRPPKRGRAVPKIWPQLGRGGIGV